VLQVDNSTAERYGLCSAAGALTGGHSGCDVRCYMRPDPFHNTLAWCFTHFPASVPGPGSCAWLTDCSCVHVHASGAGVVSTRCYIRVLLWLDFYVTDYVINCITCCMTPLCKAQQPAPQASARGALLCMTVLAPAHGANVHASAHVLFVANGSVIPLVV
jgi:hypothetical protein